MLIPMQILIASVGTLLLLGGCSSEVNGKISLDGATFEVSKCRSGQAFGFSGIQINEKSGSRLRLISQPDGSVIAALLPADDGAVGATLGKCGTLTLKAQNSRINSITNLEGHATLSCEGGGHKLSGSIKFENCH